MSIIHDALKKVQSATPAANTLASSPPAGHSQVIDTARPLTVLMIGVLCFAVIVIFAVLFKLASDTTQHSRPGAMTLPPSAIKNKSVLRKHPPVKLNSKSLPTDPTRVEGVMSMGGKMIALINGSIYEEGQSIDGKTITAINFAAVTVMEDGIKEDLPIKH